MTAPTGRLSGIPITASSPVAFPGPPPAEADVVVIGGGIIGVMTGWYLAQAGLRAVVLEKGRLAGEQSGRNWGWVRQQGRDPDELPIMVEANRLWRGLPEKLRAAVGLANPGILYMASDAAGMAKYEAWMEHARARQLDTRLLSGAEVSAQLPGATKRWAGGLFTPSDLRAEPWAAVPALARAASEDGLTVVENCAARGLERTAGHVSAVVTEAGTIRTPEVVVAAGAWSRLFLGAEGVAIPQLSVRATVAATGPLPDLGTPNGADDRIAFRRRADGGYTLAAGGFHELYIGRDAFRSLPAFFTQLRADPFGTRFLPAAPGGYPDAWGTPRRWALDGVSPFERMRVLDPAPNAKKTRTLAQDFAALFPAAGEVRLANAWAGMIDTMPDVVPVVDRVAEVPGLTIATGMSGHGFGIGPGMGRVVADLVRGRPPGHDLTRFRLSRFTDGSKVELGPAL
ncbi:NAD(P)/FAD-dependent oxidoreductase [Wenxinia marina]|uniref:Glycine/D-amino acid oxidase (Deaminating) n=1 Tax=Wenxinia marina DSM 24838 TaxID=1123501 RepID=A0A0D0QBN2_9RHOB|nr:FAD-binding oxidoreductase [Wenxinia marina]KIQ68363.1 Glycine/D-amino acid oxidase (deaminating) [Wenxinia marina DSM 24838]GGL72781.1 AgaE protein [Wenxinia marina]